MLNAMASRRVAHRFFFLLLAVAALLFGLVARPIASALFLAAALAGVVWPLHQRLSTRLWRRRTLSASALVSGVVILLIGPVIAFSAFAIKEVSAGVRYLSETVRSEGVNGLLDRLPPWLERVVRQALDRVIQNDDIDLATIIQQQLNAHGGSAAVAVRATVSATTEFAFQTAMMLIAFYFLLLEGDKLVSWLDDLSPLKSGQTREILTEFKQVSYAVILSTLITSAVQAAAALGGYLLARVPHPIFFTGVTFFAAFIPAIGAGTVCLIAALLLFATGHPYAALFLSIWGVLVVALVDNLVKPLLIKNGMEMNGAVVFFALIGGLGAFGAVGLLLGPLVVAFFLTLLRLYRRDFRNKSNTEALKQQA
jgi:predicted PurR-regulated permease PerM